MLYDISIELKETMPFWPGSAGFKLTHVQRLDCGDACNGSRLECDVHVGTHVDAPWHFLPEGATAEHLALDDLIGPALVCDAGEADAITAAVLESFLLPDSTERLLIRTKNTRLWEEGALEFNRDFVALTADAARWVVEHGLALVGIDYLSVQRFYDSAETHQILLGASVAVLEGLNLSGIEPGVYELICLPLKIAGADGAPARALLRTLPANGR